MENDIYVFLKNEAGKLEILIHVSPNVALKHIYKHILTKMNIAENKEIFLKYNGKILLESKSLFDQNIEPYSDLLMIIQNNTNYISEKESVDKELFGESYYNLSKKKISDIVLFKIISKFKENIDFNDFLSLLNFNDKELKSMIKKK